MVAYYDRRFSVDLEGKPFIEETESRPFRIQFNVLHDFGGHTSYLDLTINGLSRSTESKAFKRNQQIDIRAGYKDSIDTIFRGKVVNIFREKNAQDRVTRIMCLGGTQKRNNTSVIRSLGENTTVQQIIRACSDAMEIPVIIDDETFSNRSRYAGGFVMNDNPVAILEELSSQHKFDFVIENDRLVVVTNESYRQGTIHQISQFTGMVGAPEITETGANVTVRLEPKLQVGGRFQITSEYKTFNFSNLYFQNVEESAGLGVYKIHKVQHSGDSFGDRWETSVTGFVI